MSSEKINALQPHAELVWQIFLVQINFNVWSLK